MRTFIEDVVDKVWNQHDTIDQLIFILPSKRAGTFLKKVLSKKAGNTIFAPNIYSIEEFIETVSKLSYATATEQVFELYTAYLQTGEFEKDSFDAFLTWGQTLLQDYNEIDRYLIDANKLLSNVSAIQELNHWSTSEQKTALISNYISFWNSILPLYLQFNKNLLAKGIAHQGLAYRTAVEHISSYTRENPKPHIFLGFNALNESESTIIQYLLEHTTSSIYWDIDPYFLNDPIHDAGFFIRQHKNKWPFLKNTNLNGLSNHYLEQKHIEVIGVPKNVSQAKYVGEFLSHLQHNDSSTLKNTALILGDETLLTPLLNSIPESLPAINITMGQQLGLTPLAGFFMAYIELHETANNKGWFYKDFLAFLSHPFSTSLFTHFTIDINVITDTIKSRNWTYLKLNDLKNVIDITQPVIKTLFELKTFKTETFINNCNELVLLLKEVFTSNENNLALEQLFRFDTLFNQITLLANRYNYITTIKALKNLVKQLLSSETLDFQGDPLEGLQLMGMLESRNLDFEHIIITSVNEGILPSGKSNNSFIPFDLKLAYGMPTYKEKDAVYTYHFYRLLQRAKHVYILYNTEPDVLEGGEKSRLIAQLLTEDSGRKIIEKIASPKLQPVVNTLASIPKTETLIKQLESYSSKGFSPSSLSNYIRNPIDFYKQNLLGIKDTMAVEETIAANTFGTIAHDTLEELYTPFIGHFLTKEKLLECKKNLATTIQRNFRKTYLDGDFSTGKNYLSFQVIQKYISNFIDFEIEQVAQHKIKIVALEQNMQTVIHIPGISHPIVLKGKLDRVDEINGLTRIIDYKTGKVERRNVELPSWEELIQEYRYSKAFQLLCYAYMYLKEKPGTPVKAGIISLKNLKEGTLLFSQKTEDKGVKNSTINSEVISTFEAALHTLLLEIYDSSIPLLEKEI